MKYERQIYLLDPKNLSPETIAVTFAKTSRSPQSFHQIAVELTETQSTDFNEKWVVGYGHSSVAEHAVLHIALENVSRLAVETLESNRLASYTEKSTRYQTWGIDAFFTPPELDNHPLKNPYVRTCTALFTTYQSCLLSVTEYFKKTTIPLKNETPQQLERRFRSQAIDVCRFLLPAASLANVGMTINARALEHAIGKLLSSPLRENRQIGAELKTTALGSLPTLLKYAEMIPYQQKVCDTFSAVQVADPAIQTDWCELIHYEPDAVERILAAALYREKNISYTQAIEWVASASSEQKKELVHCLLSTPDSHTIPARELENASFTFDLLIDQGAYFEVKRHRMMTQAPQHLTASMGYAIPRAIVDAGILEPYQYAMMSAQKTYDILADFNPAVASYVVPNGYNRRVLLNLNLRSLIHFIRLRSSPNAHFSVRRVAQRMSEQVGARLPELTSLLGKYENETSASVEETSFYTTRQYTQGKGMS